MRSKKFFLLVGVATCLLFSALPTLVGATTRSYSPMSGIPMPHPGDLGAFDNNWGKITNISPDNRQFCLPAMVDATYNYTIVVNATAPAGTTVNCWADSHDQKGNYTGGSYPAIGVTGGTDDLFMSRVYAPDGGTLYACCAMDPGTTLNSYRVF